MNYLLINRENVVIDVLKDSIRYIKLQSSAGHVVACEENEATGVIGSDANTHYVLVKSDTNNNPNAVRVMELENVPSEVIAGNTKYNAETGEFEFRYSLDEIRNMKQEKNKANFAEYLASHPMTWVDGKEYGITQEDQSEISLNLNQYQIALAAGIVNPVLEWHAKHEECHPWDFDDLVALSLSITGEVYPYYHQMQQYKTQIFNAKDVDEVLAIRCTYGDTEAPEEEVNVEN